MVDGKTKIYGIIGNPVSHSLSPAMHNAAFAALAENRIYLPFPVEDVQAALAGLKALHICGVSVTIPHKETVIPSLDRIDPVALKIGAVNTIDIRTEEGARILCGSNTDWLGANRALESQIGLSQARVVLLGAGGSARAIGFGLREAGAGLVLCSRSEPKGRALAAELGCPWFPLSGLASLEGDVLVNATSVGMSPRLDASPVPAAILPAYQVVMDIVYAPLQTTLLREAEQAGCRTINGLEMLLYQGVAQFELWTGLSAPVEVMRRALLKCTGGDLS
ncbi:MAG: shikimate dehydrogenase [Desulfocapsaceae bacterium]|nr:shikimate dehydrogenase [Desulfocapsaceae bacterium]